jgi:hypothetical protein
VGEASVNPAVTQGQLIVQQWDRTTGLSESTVAFTSLDELYSYCLSVSDPQLVDRIIIRGHDEHGQPRVLTFVFQSITVTPKPE